MILAVIPARYDSTRFPGKPLALLCGKPMIQWVYERTKLCVSLDVVVVATDDERIARAVADFGGSIVMTSRDHATGTDRVAEVARHYPDAEVVVNVQGDQPMIHSAVLDALIQPFREALPPDMSTIACPFASESNRADCNCVKVVCDQRGRALYFSRAALPFFRNEVDVPVYHHLGLYAFRAAFLQQYSGLAPTPLEQCESLEQLRVLEHGHSIHVSLVDWPMLEVNTPEELTTAEDYMMQNNVQW
jgi:3-deoxy-manno-octulosonate cytidylyltransferase (CMP-KDO synthetase)